MIHIHKNERMETVTGSLEGFEAFLRKWLITARKGDTLRYDFPDDQPGDWDELEEVQMNIRSYLYPENVLISFKEIRNDKIEYFFLIAHIL